MGLRIILLPADMRRRLATVLQERGIQCAGESVDPRCGEIAMSFEKDRASVQLTGTLLPMTSNGMRIVDEVFCIRRVHPRSSRRLRAENLLWEEIERALQPIETDFAKACQLLTQKARVRSEADRVTGAEIKHRLRELDAGDVRAIPWKEARTEITARKTRRRSY